MNDSARRYLNLLSFFNYTLGVLHLFLAVVLPYLMIAPTLHYLQTVHLFLPPENLGQVRYAFMFSFGNLLLKYGLIFSVGFAYALLMVASGQCLKKRKGYGFSFTIACLQFLSIPFGAILGIITINILLKDSVKALYQSNQR